MSININSTTTLDVGGTTVSRPPDIDPPLSEEQVRRALIDIFTAAANGDTMAFIKACMVMKLLYLQNDQTNMNNKVKWYGAVDTMLKNIDNALAALSNKDQNVSSMTDINQMLGLIKGLGSANLDPELATLLWDGRQRLSTPRTDSFSKVVYGNSRPTGSVLSYLPQDVQAEINAGRARITSQGHWTSFGGRGGSGHRRTIQVEFYYARDAGLDYINKYLRGEKLSQGDIMRMKNYFLDVRNAIMNGQNVEGLSSSLKAILDEIQRTKEATQSMSQTIHQAVMAS